jgi:hypothetical protein
VRQNGDLYSILLKCINLLNSSVVSIKNSMEILISKSFLKSLTSVDASKHRKIALDICEVLYMHCRGFLAINAIYQRVPMSFLSRNKHNIV